MLLIFRRTTASFRSTVLSPLQAAILKPYSVATEPLTKPQLTTLVLSQYHQGKFSNLLQNVISSPSLLLTACHNLIHHGPNSPAPPTADYLSPNFFSIMTMAEELSQNRFDFDSCFLKMANQDEFFNNQTVSLLFVNQDWGCSDGLVQEEEQLLQAVGADFRFYYAGQAWEGKKSNEDIKVELM